MASNKIYIEFSDLWTRIIQRSEIALRIHNDSGLVLTEEYEAINLEFFGDGARNLRNEYIGFLPYKDFEDTLIYELPETLTEFKSMKALIEKAIIHFVLSEWYRTNGAFELSAESRAVYEQCGVELQGSSVQSGFVKPKFKPYF